MAASRGTATKAASGASGKSAMLANALRPPTSTRFGFTAHTGPAKPMRSHCLTTSAASRPPMTAMERGDSRRARGARIMLALAPQRAQQRTRDNVALDFAGAVPDALDPRIAPEALDGQGRH